MTEPCDLSAVEARRLIGRKALSPVELTDSCISDRGSGWRGKRHGHTRPSGLVKRRRPPKRPSRVVTNLASFARIADGREGFERHRGRADIRFPDPR